MKKSIIIIFLLLVMAVPGFARDFIVEFIEENYKETQAEFSYQPLIYHSIQVNTSIGPKLLILTGNDYQYRKWLRQYIAQNKKFILTIADDRSDEFISSKAYLTDVRTLNPFNGEKWGKTGIKALGQKKIKGSRFILILDPDNKRTHLLKTIATKMGYNTIIFKTNEHALDSFKLQPEKFKMVIVSHMIGNDHSSEFIEQVLNLNHKIPIIIDTGYHNLKLKNQFVSKFSRFKSVHVKPVILKDLQKTIQTLIKKNA